MTQSAYKILLLIMILVGLFTPISSAKQVPANHIEWYTLSDPLKDEAKQANRPLLFYFSTSWCHWCKKMDSTTLNNPAVINYIHLHFIPIKIDAEVNGNVAAHYRVTNIPALVVVDDNDKILGSFSGYNTPEELITKLKSIQLSNKISSDALSKITIIGNPTSAETEALEKAARTHEKSGFVVEVIDSRNDANKAILQKYPRLSKPAAFLCIDGTCSMPIFNSLQLSTTIKTMQSTSKNKPIMDQTDDHLSEPYFFSNKHLIISLLGFFCFGILLAFTPCMLPLIIIISGLIGGRMGNESNLKIIYLTLTYIFALAITYAIAGIIAAIFGFYIQSYFQNRWIIGTFSLIFVLLALSLLGFYKLKLPDSWMHRIVRYNKLRTDYSYFQVAVMGVLATLIASPCAAAPLLGVLSYVGKTGNFLTGGASLFFVGLGIGTPLLLAVMAGSSFLPHSKIFQEGLKIFFGIVMLGIAIWLLQHIIPKWLSMGLWSALVLYLAIQMASFHKDISNNLGKIWNLLNLMILIYGIAILLGALIGNTDPLRPLLIKPSETIGYDYSTNSFQVISTTDSFNKELEAAKANNKFTLILFSAGWCQSCADLKATLLDKSLEKLVHQFALLEINIVETTGTELAKIYHVAAPPSLVILNQEGNRLNIEQPIAYDKKTMSDYLQKILRN